MSNAMAVKVQTALIRVTPFALSPTRYAAAARYLPKRRLTKREYAGALRAAGFDAAEKRRTVSRYDSRGEAGTDADDSVNCPPANRPATRFGCAGSHSTSPQLLRPEAISPPFGRSDDRP